MKLFKLKSTMFSNGSDGRNAFVGKPRLALVSLFGLFVAALLIMSVVGSVIAAKIGTSTASIRIMSVAQDILVFILPALVTAVVATRLPATLLRIDCGTSLKVFLLSLAVLLFAMPAMNFIITLNEALTLPEFLKPIEDVLQKMEKEAALSLNMLQGGDSFGDLIISILIIGVLAAFAEEIFFRGALQQLLLKFNINPHIAIWVAAIIFSFMHFQFYGFIPRLLLGAYFGYVVWWSGSLWTAVSVHALNNTLVVIVGWISRKYAVSNLTEEIGATLHPTAQELLSIILSVVVTVLGLAILRRTALKTKNSK